MLFMFQRYWLSEVFVVLLRQVLFQGEELTLNDIQRNVQDIQNPNRHLLYRYIFNYRAKYKSTNHQNKPLPPLQSQHSSPLH